MKSTIVLIIMVLSMNCYGQTSKQNELSYTNFDSEIFNYHPDKTKISERSFEEGSFFLKEVKKRISINKNLYVVDYFNLLSAFVTLNESEKSIKIVFKKFKEAEGSCEYILSFEDDIQKNSRYDVIREEYTIELVKCKAQPITEKKFDILEYCKTNNFDVKLIQKINQINLTDKFYRIKPMNKNTRAKQNQLDKLNQKSIDSLFYVHKSYLGKTIVGKKFKYVMWAVIQHSNPEMMERYLPIIQKEVSENELSVGVFKMLIDRIYWLKYDYQVFGSQQGVRIADEKTRNEIIKKYGIE